MIRVQYSSSQLLILFLCVHNNFFQIFMNQFIVIFVKCRRRCPTSCPVIITKGNSLVQALLVEDIRGECDTSTTNCTYINCLM